MPRALITGAAGFVGEYLVNHLIGNGLEVSITKLPNEVFDNESVQGVYDMDVRDMPQVEMVLSSSKPDYIVHLSAQSSVARSWKLPADTMSINAIGTINLLEAIHKLGLQAKVLLIGSGEEYGAIKLEDVPINEMCLVRPFNFYAVSKVAQTMIGQVYSEAYGMHVVIARAFNHIGPKQNPSFVVASFAKQIAEIEKGIAQNVVKVGNLDVRRDFTDVRDIVKGYYLLLQKGKAGQCYNIGSGRSTAIREILNSLLSMSAEKVEIIKDEEKMRHLDIPTIEADISKIAHELGWQPEISLNQSLEDILCYWRGQV